MSFPEISRLAERVESAWRRDGHRLESFPAIAAEALRAPLALDFEEVARRLCAGARLPPQRRLDRGFGEPAITVHHGERFDVELLCWHEGTPAIHDHAFAGAFRMMTGSSIQSCYRFDPVTRLGALDIGRLGLESVERLTPGAVVAIQPSAQMIHTAFHLDHPSMTLVVRTHQSRTPERTYLAPGIAFDSGARSPELHKRLQMLDTLNAAAHPVHVEAARAAIASGDAYEVLAVMLRIGSHRIDDDRYAGLLAKVRSRFGDHGDVLAEAIAEERRRGVLVRMRRAEHDPEARFALACLMICPQVDRLIAVLGTAWPGIDRRGLAERLAPLAEKDEMRLPLATLAIAALLDGASAERFRAAAAPLLDAPTDDGSSALLERYFGQLASLPWLTAVMRAR